MEYQIPETDLALNVFGVKNTGAWDAAQLASLGAAFHTWHDTLVGGQSPYSLRNPDTSIIQTTCRDLTTQTSPVVVVPYTGAHAVGTSAGATLNNGLTKAFTARSGLSGRSQRGRTFVVGPTDAAEAGGDPNLINSTWANDWVACFNALIAAVTAANAAWTLVVISRFHNGAPRAAGVTTPITSYGYSNLYMDFQRRRAPGHARHH
jgi:hypothetical protein